MTRCELTDLLASDCAHCRGLPDPGLEQEQATEDGELGPIFTARFAGACSDCLGPIYQGDKIRAAGGGTYLCNSCIDA